MKEQDRDELVRKMNELLDKAVAEKVMGLEIVPDPVSWRGVSVGLAGVHGRDLPEYSSKIDRAMEVVDRMRQLGHRWLINIDDGGFHLRHVVCVHQNDIRGEKEYTCDRPLGSAERMEDLPKVICEAALREIGVHEIGQR